MAIGEFYDLPEIHLRSATPDKFAECIKWRRSTEKANWESEKLDLAPRRPEELPPCFLAVKKESISFREGWETDHGKWVPKESYANRGFRDYFANMMLRMSRAPVGTPSLPPSNRMWMRTTLVFVPNKGGRKCNMVLMLYNTLSENSTLGEHSALVEEDISICCVFQDPKENGKGVVRSEAPSIPTWQLPNGFSSIGVVRSEAPSIPTWQLPPPPDNNRAICNFLLSDMESIYSNVEGNTMAGWDLNSIDPDGGGPQKRKRSNSKPVGGSKAWLSFIRIYTNDSKETKVVYAACLHCRRLMSVKDGSTKSLLTHNESCQCKPDSSVDTSH